jgi:hypothetical protein
MKIAVIAKEGIRLDAFLSSVENSLLAEAEICLLSASPEDQSAVCGNKALAFSLIDEFDFNGLSLCIVLESKLVVDAFAEQLSNLSCPVLGFYDDLESLDATLYGAGSELELGTRVGLAQPAVLALQQVFQQFELDSLDATVLYPVSAFGQQAVEELAAQTAKLLNGQAVEPALFHTQMAFNYFPMQASSQGGAIAASLSSQLEAVFAGAEVNARALQMPVFHGLGISLTAEVAEPVSKLEFFEQLNLQEGIETHDLALSNYEFVQYAGITVSNFQLLAAEGEKSYRFECMIGLDDVKFAFAQNLVAVAEKLLKSYL